jgi:hypothetical protein
MQASRRLAALLMRNIDEVPGAASLMREIRMYRARVEDGASEQEREYARGQLEAKVSQLSTAVQSAHSTDGRRGMTGHR